MDRSKKLRKSVYEIDENMKEKFPRKATTDVLDPKVKEKLNLLKETLDDDIEHLQITEDEDAKLGHKTADTSFFGFKTHIAMTNEFLNL